MIRSPAATPLVFHFSIVKRNLLLVLKVSYHRRSDYPNSITMLFSAVFAGAALIGHAAAVANLRVSEAAYSASRSCYVSSMLSSYSNAIASSTATSVGALSTSILAPSVPQLPPSPSTTAYPRDGQLHGAQPAPFTPSGGLGTNGSEPVYIPETDFDFQSMVRLRTVLDWH